MRTIRESDALSQTLPKSISAAHKPDSTNLREKTLRTAEQTDCSACLVRKGKRSTLKTEERMRNPVVILE